MPDDAVLAYRLERVEKSNSQKADKDDLNQVAAEVRGLRKVLIGFAVTVAGSSLLFSFTVLQLLANNHP